MANAYYTEINGRSLMVQPTGEVTQEGRLLGYVCHEDETSRKWSARVEKGEAPVYFRSRRAALEHLCEGAERQERAHVE